ncbi:hypothetical protein J6590_093546 [Homalodisca vitripennis]|nr:hypothetical protein J6590_093546 [Homalodisca vitripennis]
MADDTNNLNNSAFGEDVSEKKLAFREKQKKARLNEKSYMTLNKHTRKEIAAKPLPAVEVSCKCRYSCGEIVNMKTKLFED